MFEKLTRFTEKFAYHKHAPYWLFFYSVIESVIFPVPPDVLLVALTLGRPKRAYGFALIAAIGSVAGGVIGYMLGRYAFDPVVKPALEWACQYASAMCPNTFIPEFQSLFDKHGFWIVALSAMSPIIPYRFTILVVGMAQLALVPFIVISFAAHFFRYAIVCGLVRHYGVKAIDVIKNRMPIVFVGGGVVALAVYVVLHYF